MKYKQLKELLGTPDVVLLYEGSLICGHSLQLCESEGEEDFGREVLCLDLDKYGNESVCLSIDSKFDYPVVAYKKM